MNEPGQTEAERHFAAATRSLIDTYGSNAGQISANMAEQRLALGDVDGARMWLKVKREIERLQAIEPVGSGRL